MATVKCAVEFTTKENDNGREQACVVVKCEECDHETWSWGDSDRSVRRCLALLGEECPMDEKNFYVRES